MSGARLAALREDVVSTLEQIRDERENAEGAIAALRGLLPEVTAGLPRDELRVVFKLDLLMQVVSAFAALEEALVRVRDHIDRQLGYE